MGVCGLFEYCELHRREVSTRVDLLDLQRPFKHRPVELLVDLKDFETFVVDSVIDRATLVESNEENDRMISCGGDYDKYDSFVQGFISTLKKLKIQLRFYATKTLIDEEIPGRVLDRCTARTSKRCAFIEGVRQWLENPGSEEENDWRPSKCLRSPLLRTQVLKSIQEAGAVVVVNVVKETTSLATELSRRRDALAILARAEDNAIVKGSRFIPFAWFDVRDDLGIRTKKFASLQAFNPGPHKLFCDVITPEKLAFSMGLSNPQLLAEVAILKGNNFTHKIMRNVRLRDKLRLPRTHWIEDFAAWVARHGEIESNAFLYHLMRTDLDFREAVSASRRLYWASASSFFQLPSTDTQLRDAIDRRVNAVSGAFYVRFPPDFLAMHHGLYRPIGCTLYGEKDSSGGIIVEQTTSVVRRLRSLLYDVLVPSGQTTREIFDRPDADGVVIEDVKAAGILESLVNLSLKSKPDRTNELTRALKYAADVVGDEKSANDFLQRFGLRKLCLLWLFRFSAQGFFLENSERYAVYESMTGDHLYETAHAPRPSFRCWSVFNLLQVVYLHLWWLTLALELDDLPQPADIFNGQSFVHLFMLNDYDRSKLESQALFKATVA